jgi:hypothetical protein
LGKSEAQGLVRLFEDAARGRVGVRQRLTHPRELRALTGEKKRSFRCQTGL